MNIITKDEYAEAVTDAISDAFDPFEDPKFADEIDGLVADGKQEQARERLNDRVYEACLFGGHLPIDGNLAGEQMTPVEAGCVIEHGPRHVRSAAQRVLAARGTDLKRLDGKNPVHAARDAALAAFFADVRSAVWDRVREHVED